MSSSICSCHALNPGRFAASFRALSGVASSTLASKTFGAVCDTLLKNDVFPLPCELSLCRFLNVHFLDRVRAFDRIRPPPTPHTHKRKITVGWEGLQKYWTRLAQMMDPTGSKIQSEIGHKIHHLRSRGLRYQNVVHNCQNMFNHVQ